MRIVKRPQNQEKNRLLTNISYVVRNHKFIVINSRKWYGSLRWRQSRYNKTFLKRQDKYILLILAQFFSKTLYFLYKI